MARKKKPLKWKLVDTFDVAKYKCGLKAGESVRLLKDLRMKYKNGKLTLEVYKSGDVWRVVYGSSQDPGMVFFRKPNGDTHLWGDDVSIFETFEKIKARRTSVRRARAKRKPRKAAKKQSTGSRRPARAKKQLRNRPSAAKGSRKKGRAKKG
jgi:hypothetical protein